MLTPDPSDYRLYRSQTALMAAVLRHVAQSGLTWHLVATTPEAKALAAVRKLHEKFYVLLEPKAWTLRRKAGLPVARLHLGPFPRGGVWPYVLLSDRKLKGERMQNAKQKPLRWVAWRKDAWRPTYELRFDERGKWTWYLVEAFYRELLEEALYYAEKGDWPRLVGHMKTLGNLPAFRGVFLQLQDIKKRVMKRWGDRHLRSPAGQWKTPPWKKALEGWPARPISPVRVYLYVDPEVDGDRPRTLGAWFSSKG